MFKKCNKLTHSRFVGVDWDQAQVGVTGHITGAVVGFLLGNVLLRLRDLKSYNTWKKAIWWCSLVIFIELFLGAIFINIFTNVL